MSNVSLEKATTQEILPNAVTPRELTELLLAYYPNRSPKVIISGPPGCGKSSIIYHTFRDILKVPVYVYQAMLYDMTEVKGLPVYVDGKAKFLPFEDMKSGQEGVLFIDDLPHAPSQTQNAFMRLILEGIAGAWDLGNLYPICAGNRSKDRAGSKDLQTAMATRFNQLELVTSYEDWRAWAVAKNIHPAVIAYLGSPYGDGWLNKFNPSLQINPTQRTWEFVSQAMYALDKNKSLLNKAVSGCVGVDAQIRFFAWMEVYNKLPYLNKIISGEDIYVKDMDIMYAVISGLVSIASSTKKEVKGEYIYDKKIFQRLIDYSIHIPDEFAELGAFLGKDLFNLDLKTFEGLDIEEYYKKFEGMVV
jgi:hypothetical protein